MGCWNFTFCFITFFYIILVTIFKNQVFRQFVRYTLLSWLLSCYSTSFFSSYRVRIISIGFESNPCTILKYFRLLVGSWSNRSPIRAISRISSVSELNTKWLHFYVENILICSQYCIKNKYFRAQFGLDSFTNFGWF